MNNKYQEALDVVNQSDDEKFIKDSRAYYKKYKINPVAVLQELVDKETPMKVGNLQPLVLEEDIKNYGNARFNLCPKCKRIVYPFHISDYSKIKYCENCGQKLDWSEKR